MADDTTNTSPTLSDSQLGVVVLKHIHDGVDSPKIDYKNILNTPTISMGLNPAYQLVYNLSTDGTFANNSAIYYPSQSAVVTYVAAHRGLNWTNGNFSQDMSVASSTTTVIAHGLGRTPVMFKVTGLLSGTPGVYTSVGSYNGTNNQYVLTFTDNTHAYSGSGTNYCIVYNSSTTAGDFQYGAATWDGTNVTITWLKVNHPVGTMYFIWEAQ